MITVKKLGKTKDYVYDISLDGTFVAGEGQIVVSNTDGFNFQLPPEETFRYTKEHPYIGKGLNREVKEGVEYTGFAADVAEFNDLYMHKVYSPKGVQKMGLGIDECVESTINFSRKNYADYFPDKPEGEQIKMVGNSIKSKSMPEYISKFLTRGILLLLQGKGQEFIQAYQEYVTKIYNYAIPLKDIASKGKIKRSLKEYINGTKELTKAGRPKSRQAWYELALKHNLIVNNGDVIYYINTGEKKSNSSDVKKITHYYIDKEGEKVEITKEISREYTKFRKKCRENGVEKSKIMEKNDWLDENYHGYYTEDEIILNCVLVPQEMIDSEEDAFCDENIKYNTEKYIEQFNKRINPLFVCFSKDIREKIPIKSPDEISYFTEKQCELVSGEPNKASDQDTYEQLMTMEDKEIKFWTANNLIPPFLEECNMGKWEDIVNDYQARQEKEKELGIDKEREYYQSIVDKLTKQETQDLIDEGIMPSSLDKICILSEDNSFMSKKFEDVRLGSIYDIIDANFIESVEDGE